MQVSLKLKRKLEKFLQQHPRSVEYGGYLFSNNRGNISFFLPIPNISNSPQNSYKPPENARDLAGKLADAKRMKVSAFFHSHPTPQIMSVADVTVCDTGNYQYLYFVMVTPKREYGKDFVWYASYGAKPEEIIFV